MIFTAGPLARSQTTSQRFKDVGALNLAPTTVGEVRVTGLKCRISSTYDDLCIHLWAHVAQTLLNRVIPASKSILATNVVLAVDLFPRPAMIVSFSKPSEQVLGKLLALGFSQQTQGTYKFFKGPGTDSAIRDLTAAGAELDAHSPRNCTSVHGIMTLGVINRVLHAAFSILAQVADIKPDGFKTIYKQKPYAIISKDHTFTSKGNFLPYFDGLLLSDDGFTMNTFLGHFSPLLGSTPKDMCDNAATLISGWMTLANTPAGRAISHAIFCLDMALKNGYDVRPVFLNNEYNGCMFLGNNTLFLQGRKLVPPQAPSSLAEDLASLSGHESSLDAICTLLSARKLQSTGETSAFTSAVITSARTLHNRLTERVLTPEDHATLKPDIRRLKFNQEFWDTSNPRHIQALVQSLVTKEKLPGSAPIYIQSDAFFSNDYVFSAVAAFGPSAPSLLGYGTVIAKPFAKDTYKVTKPGNLAGIPVFSKNLQQAYEDWKKFLGDGVVSFNHAGKDKLGRLKVKNLAGLILFDSPEEKEIMSRLLNYFNSRGGKRKAVEMAATSDEQRDAEAEERHKRRRVQGMGMLGLMAVPGVEPGEPSAATEGQMDLDDLFDGL